MNRKRYLIVLCNFHGRKVEIIILTLLETLKGLVKKQKYFCFGNIKSSFAFSFKKVGKEE